MKNGREIKLVIKRDEMEVCSIDLMSFSFGLTTVEYEEDGRNLPDITNLEKSERKATIYVDINPTYGDAEKLLTLEARDDFYGKITVKDGSNLMVYDLKQMHFIDVTMELIRESPYSAYDNDSDSSKILPINKATIVAKEITLNGKLIKQWPLPTPT